MNEPNTSTASKLPTRRDLEFHEQIKAHGGSGFPPDGLTIDAACRAGICMKCGGQWDALHTHVWKHYPGLSMADGIAAFRKEYDYAGPLDSDAHRETLRRAKLKTYQGAAGDRIRAKISAAGRGKANHRAPVQNWPLVRLLSQGESPEGVCKTLQLEGTLTPHAIGARARSMGYAYGTPAVCDHGQPFRNGSLLHLREVSGFECSDFERRVGLSEGRSAATRPADSIVNPSDAKKVIDWRDEIIRQLLRVASETQRALRLGEKIFRQDEILATLVPEIRDVNRALQLAMPAIHHEARNNPGWDMAALGEFVSTQAAIETSRAGQDMRWRVTLRYLWQCEGFLQSNLTRLRGLTADGVGDFVHEMIGSRFGVTGATFQNSLRERTERIAPSDIAALILALRVEQLEGTLTGRPPENTDRDRQAAELHAGGKSYAAIAQALDPERFKADRKKATEAIRGAIRRFNEGRS